MIPPVILEGEISALPSGQIRGLLDARGLQNRTDKILRIDELRFVLLNPTFVSNTPKFGLSTSLAAFFAAEVQLRIGNEPITAGFVPLPAMTWPELDVVAEIETPAGFYLRFSRPVLLAPGEAINLQIVQRSGAEVIFQVTAICREASLSGGSFTPWISFYKPPARTDGSGNFIDTSTSVDLVNPFDKEIVVERFIGRISVDGTWEGVNVGYPFRAVRVQMEDHEANQIVRESTPFGVVFDYTKRTWETSVRLPPKGFFVVTVESNFDPAAVGAAVIQPFIGMLAYRPVR